MPARLLQQVRQRILAPLQCFQPGGLQRQHALVQRQRGVRTADQASRLVRTRRRLHHVVQPGMLGFARAQACGQRVGLGLRHLQFARQRKPFARFGEPALRERGARLSQRFLAYPTQSHGRFAAVGIQRLRRFVELARATAVGGIETPVGQRAGRLVEQCLHPRLGPQHVRQRTAEHDQQHDQQQRHQQGPSPIPPVAPGGDRMITPCARGRDDARPVDARFDAAIAAGVGAVFAGHARRITAQPERRASSTPGSASSLPSRVES